MSGLRGRRVLVTGAGGFIGGRVVLALRKAGADARVVTRKEADLEVPGEARRAVAAADPELAFHLAKPRGAQPLEREARMTLLLADALKSSAPRLERLVRTAHAERGHGRGADAVLAAKLGLPVVTLDLRLVYGPGQRDGDFPLSVIDAALAGRRAPPAEPGARDYVFVDDVAQAYCLAALSPKAEGSSIEIGSGVLTANARVRALALAAAGSAPPNIHVDNLGTTQGHPADLSKAKELLGWSPRTSLDEGLAQLVQWRRSESRAL